MNRKTNIFYNSNSNDSKFITFNNYAEALTGDILATDYKLWPSRFLCIYIDDLDKEEFINELTYYYENKLAFLRDNVDDHSKLLPLNYLITFLYYYAYKNETEGNLPFDSTSDDNLNIQYIKTISSCEKTLASNSNDLSIYDKVQLNYIGDIVEQDYNGTYADIICTINPSKWQKPIIQFNGTEYHYNLEGSVFPLEDTNFLYGWENETDTESAIYSIIHNNPTYDDIKIVEGEEKKIYYVNSLIDSIKLVDVIDENTLKFNIIIPLFNIINTINANDIENDEEDADTIILNNKVNIPLGIYFSDTPIELTINGQFSTNWSLLISTQFSAFPFSYDIKQNFDNTDAIKSAYITFAEILAKQTNFIDLLRKYDAVIKTLQNRITLLESKINNISSVQNIDEMSQDIINFKANQEQKFKNIEEQMNELRELIESSRLKWKLVQQNNNE